MKFSEFISISPGFKPAVNIKDDMDSKIKIQAYIPTKDKIDILYDISESLVNEGNRVRHFTGPVGTGKSNFALIVGNYFKEIVTENKHVPMSDVLEKIKNADEKQYRAIVKNRNDIYKKYLLIPIEGYYKSVNQALIDGLDRVLIENAELSDVMPKTAYMAACDLIDEWKNKHSFIYEKLQTIVKVSKYKESELLINNLKKFDEEALDYFQSIFSDLTGVKGFYRYHAQNAKDVYNEVVKELQAKGYQGILIIWDEFGSNLERIVADSDGVEYLELQRFAENCNQLGKEEQIHLMLISHNSIKDLASKSVATQKILEDKNSNLSKFEGRFARVKRFSYDSKEIFDLIINIIIQRDSFKNQILQKYKGDIDSILNMTFELGLYYNYTREQLESFIYRAIPLHPFSLYALMKICDKFAQNERSAFTFMCSDGAGTFKNFCNTAEIAKAHKLNLITADKIFDYFYEQIKNNINSTVNNQYKETLIDFERAINSGIQMSELQVSILKCIFLINLIDHYRLYPTAENIAFALDMLNEKEKIRRLLDALCNGEHRILGYSRSEHSYRFISSKFNIETNVKKYMGFNDYKNFDTTKYLEKIKMDLNIADNIVSSDYRAKYKVSRKFDIILTKPEQLKDINKYTAQIANNYLDGIALIVLCENIIDVETAKRYAQEVTHNQIIIGVPKRPIKYSEYIGELDALEKVDPPSFRDEDERKRYSEEKNIYQEEVIKLLKKELELVVDFTGQHQVMWYSNAILQHNVDDLEEFICRILENTFNRMPIISHKSLLSEEGNDGQKPYRISVIDKMFSENAIDEFNSEQQSPVKTIVTLVLKECDMLKENDFSIPRIDKNENAFYVWKVIEEYIVNSEKYFTLHELIQILRKPPYGLKPRVIPIFLGAVFSKHIQNIRIKTNKPVNIIVDGNFIEEIYDNAKQVQIKYCELTKRDKLFIHCLEKVYDNELQSVPIRAKYSSDRIGRIHRVIRDWWIQQPFIAKDAVWISQDAILFRKQVLEHIDKTTDSANLILTEMKELMDMDREEEFAEKMQRLKDEYDNILNYLKNKIFETIYQVLREFSKDEFAKLSDKDIIKNFYSHLNNHMKNVILTGHEIKVRNWLKRMSDNFSEIEAVRIAEELLNIDTVDWQNKHLSEFKNLFRNCITNITSLQEQGSMGKNSSNKLITLNINSKKYFLDVPNKLNDFTLETKNLIEAMLDDIPLDQKQKMFILIKLLEERLFNQ